MKLNRRLFLSTGVATSGFLATTNIAAAQDSRRGEPRKTFILVHGSWFSSGVWERVGHQLVAAGHSVIASDLPGLGLNAEFPQTYFQRPLDTAGFSQEPSSVAGITLADYVNSIVGSIQDALSGGSGPVILVGHSSGGFSITPVAEQFPAYISDLVYLAGHMEAAGITPFADVTSSVNDPPNLVTPLLFGDPTKVGALRIDWNSGDATYVAQAQNAFANDSDLATFRALGNLLTPDDPFLPWSTPTVKTPKRWGRVRRSYIRTGQDNAIRPALQDYWIAQADAFVPSNKTTVYRLDSSHTPFISQPDNLVAALLDIANRPLNP